MFGALLCALWGATTFVGEELPGISVGPVQPLSGIATVNFRHVDLNQDGAQDLLFSESAFFQQEGRFPAAKHIALPLPQTPYFLDVWNDTLYFLTEDRLHAVRWEDAGWKTVLEQTIPLPTGHALVGESLPARQEVGNLSPFLFDLDQDNVPEVVAVGITGLHLFQQREGQYQAAGVLDAIPTPRLVRVAPQPLWPTDTRRSVLPGRQSNCRLSLDTDGLSVLTWRAVDLADGAAGLAFTRMTYALRHDQEWTLMAEPPEAIASEPMPDFLQPGRLNDDPRPDFAGFRWTTSRSSQLPIPLYETWATLDSGKTFFVRRNPAPEGFRPQCAFIDFDSDGDLEMVTEATRLYVGGARETIGRLLAQPSVDHELRVYEQVQGNFARIPRIDSTFSIRLTEPPFRSGELFRRYQAGALLNITGDFNGDGYRDLVVRDAVDRLAIYIAAGFGYATRPSTTLSLPASAKFSVADINGDGRSDIVLQWYESTNVSGVSAAGSGSMEANAQTLVYYSEESP
jgi:hypothetical protein